LVLIFVEIDAGGRRLCRT